jgi:hypothetical protein
MCFAMTDHKVILEDHVELGELVRDLRLICAWKTDVLKIQAVRVKLAKDIRALKDQLRRHFATEESGNYLQEISIRKPEARKILLQLHSEHVPFLHMLTGVEEACMEHEPDVETPDLTVKLLHVLDLLKLHEQRETALIREVFQG